MTSLATMLPEYPVVMSFFGVGENLTSRIIAEIGDIRCFPRKNLLFVLLDLKLHRMNPGSSFHQTEQSQKKVLPILSYLYYSYMAAGSAKFLRLYYARTKEYLDNLDK